jgi:hypothetical protein
MNSTSEKNKKSYSNGKIYQVLNRINNEVYVGSTCSKLRKRMTDHRRRADEHEGKLYDEMRRVCTTHFYIELIENYPCDNKDDLTAREQFYIRERGTLNNNATRPDDTNKDVIILQEMLYRLQTRLDKLEHQHNTTPMQIKDKMIMLLNSVYPATPSTQSSDGESQWMKMDPDRVELHQLELMD